MYSPNPLLLHKMQVFYLLNSKDKIYLDYNSDNLPSYSKGAIEEIPYTTNFPSFLLLQSIPVHSKTDI